MSIRLTQDTRIAGVIQPANTSLTLDASLEAQLVTDNKAVFTTTPVLDQADRDKLAAALANYGLVIESGTTLYVGPTDPSAQMSVGDVWIDSSAA